MNLPLPALQNAVIYSRQSDSEAEDVAAGNSLSSRNQLAIGIDYCNRNRFIPLRELSEQSADLDTSSMVKARDRARAAKKGKRA